MTSALAHDKPHPWADLPPAQLKREARAYPKTYQRFIEHENRRKLAMEQQKQKARIKADRKASNEKLRRLRLNRWLDMIAEAKEKRKAENVLPINCALIARAVSTVTQVPMHELKGIRRNKNIVTARQVAFYLCAKHTRASLPAIGLFFGNKDHSTVLHGRDKVSHRMQDYESVIRRVMAEINSLRGN